MGNLSSNKSLKRQKIYILNGFDVQLFENLPGLGLENENALNLKEKPIDFLFIYILLRYNFLYLSFPFYQSKKSI